MGPALVLAAAVAIACLLWLVREIRALRRARLEEGAGQALGLLQQQLDALRAQLQQGMEGVSATVAGRLDSVTGQVDARMAELSGAVQAGTSQQTSLQQGLQATLQGMDQTGRQVVAQLAHVREASSRVEELGRSLASLQDLLKPTKLRGELGESMLAGILAQALPAEQVISQFAFRSGAKVDFVIKCPQGLVPIDVKFPMDAFLRLARATDDDARASARQEFRKALKINIDEIAEKYICPDEGTLDFAFMYIPAEGVYGELSAWDPGRYGDDLIAYARRRRVIPVSPNTLFAYLQTVLIGLKGLRIEAEAKSIREGLARVQGDLQRVLDRHATLGTHLKNAGGTYAELEKGLGGLSQRLAGLDGGGAALPAAAPPVASSPASAPSATPPPASALPTARLAS